MIVSHDLTIVAMIANASIVVKAVMATLALASLFSWTYIFMKVFALRRAHRQAEDFEREFWGGVTGFEALPPPWSASPEETPSRSGITPTCGGSRRSPAGE